MASCGFQYLRSNLRYLKHLRWINPIKYYLETGVLSPALSLLAKSGVPGALLTPDSGVPDLEPGLFRPEGYTFPLGVNIFTFQFYHNLL